MTVCLQIREEIDHYGIRIYQFPECDSDEDEEFKLQDQALKVGLGPPAPSLEGQSHVTLGYLQDSLGPCKLSSMEGLAHISLPRQCHQDPTGDTCSLVGWGLAGETYATTSAVPLELSVAVTLGYLGKWLLDTAEEGM